MQVTTLIPLAVNDGKLFANSRLEKLLDDLAAEIQGCSTDGKVEGRSIDQGQWHRDVSLRVTIVCEREQLMQVQKRVIKIGKMLGQRTMFFDVRDNDGVQLLPALADAK